VTASLTPNPDQHHRPCRPYTRPALGHPLPAHGTDRRSTPWILLDSRVRCV